MGLCIHGAHQPEFGGNPPAFGPFIQTDEPQDSFAQTDDPRHANSQRAALRERAFGVGKALGVDAVIALEYPLPGEAFLDEGLRHHVASRANKMGKFCLLDFMRNRRGQRLGGGKPGFFFGPFDEAKMVFYMHRAAFQDQNVPSLLELREEKTVGGAITGDVLGEIRMRGRPAPDHSRFVHRKGLRQVRFLAEAVPDCREGKRADLPGGDAHFFVTEAREPTVNPVHIPRRVERAHVLADVPYPLDHDVHLPILSRQSFLVIHTA